MSREEFEELIDLYLSGELSGRRRAAFRAEMVRDRERYEAVRRARDCHGVVEDYFEYLRPRRESMADRVLGEVLEDAPSRRTMSPPLLDRRRLTWVLGSVGVAAAAVLAIVLLRVNGLESRVLARVARVEGEVSLLESSGIARSLERGRRVRAGETVEIDADGLVTLRFDDGAYARFTGEGRLELESRGGISVLRPFGGELHVTGAGADSALRVETMVGEIEVASGPADFVVAHGGVRSSPGDVDSASGVRLEVERGEVELVDRAGGRELSEVGALGGGTFEVDRDGRVSQIEAPERLASATRDGGARDAAARDGAAPEPGLSARPDRSPSRDDRVVTGTAPIRHRDGARAIGDLLDQSALDLERIVKARRSKGSVSSILELGLAVEARRRAIVDRFAATTSRRGWDELLISLTGDLALGGREGFAGQLSDAILVDLSTMGRDADATITSRLGYSAWGARQRGALSMAYVTVPDARLESDLWSATLEHGERRLCGLVIARALLQRPGSSGRSTDAVVEYLSELLHRERSPLTREALVALLPFLPGARAERLIEELDREAPIGSYVRSGLDRAVSTGRSFEPEFVRLLLRHNRPFALQYLSYAALRGEAWRYNDPKIYDQVADKIGARDRLSRSAARPAWLAGELLTSSIRFEPRSIHPKLFMYFVSGKVRIGEFLPLASDVSRWKKVLQGEFDLGATQCATLLVELLVDGAPRFWTDAPERERAEILRDELRSLSKLMKDVDGTLVVEPLLASLLRSDLNWRYRHWFQLFGGGE